MGPPVWLPQTHTEEAHKQFQDEQVDADGQESGKDRLLRTRPSVLGTLSKGSCVIYDSRVLHCGTANKSLDRSRALFYFSFRNPAVVYPGNPASIRSDLAQARIPISDLTAALDQWHAGKPSSLLSTFRFEWNNVLSVKLVSCVTLALEYSAISLAANKLYDRQK